MFQNDEQFNLWCYQHGVSSAAKSILEQIRSSQPSRLVRGGKHNMVGRFPSRKMGVVIQFESHKNELPHIRLLDAEDNDVIEFYDQPPKIKLAYLGKTGRHICVFHIPDFFVVRKEVAGWEECKTEMALIELESNNPNRYCRDEAGIWHSPPGEEYAAQFGFYYKIISSKDINWIFQRNLEFLEDYLRVDSPIVSPPARDAVLAQVSSNFGLSLDELFNRTAHQASRDDIFMMIAHEEIYIDLSLIAIPEFRHVRIFPNKQVAFAYQSILHDSAALHLGAVPSLTLQTQDVVRWDNRNWQVANVGEKFVSLLNNENKLTEIPISIVNTLIEEGKLIGASSTTFSKKVALDHPEVKKKFSEASPHFLEVANQRLTLVRAYLSREPLPINAGVSERTVRLWASAYRKAEDTYGCGYVGLIPLPNHGNVTTRLPTNSKNLMDEFIHNSYEDLKHRRRRATHNLYVRACEEKNIEPASYTTFCKAVKLRPRKTQKEKRLGHRGAYSEGGFHWELELTSPRHGERPFQIVHIDHTLADVEAACSHTAKDMGRPWFSQMTDAYSRRVLAKYTTYDPPSARTIMMLIRECVRRFKRFPQTIIVDGAFEFSCTYFETLLAIFEATKKVRPPAEARFGSPIERLFGTANSQFFHNLEGNTQIMKNIRQVTKHVNPRNRAIWMLENLDARLTEWAYEVYDTSEHPALGQSPREAFNQGMALYGNRTFKLIPYDNTFLMLTMPATQRGRAKVGTQGVKINHIHYWSDSFNDERVKGTSILTRFDPWNAGVIYGFVRGQWVVARSQYYAAFLNRSEREMMLASEELRRRNSLYGGRYKITARRLAEFLQSIESEEVLLHQRLADLAARHIAVKSGLLASDYIYGVNPLVSQSGQEDTLVSEQADDNGTNSDAMSVTQIYKTV
jgi:putative transposase